MTEVTNQVICAFCNAESNEDEDIMFFMAKDKKTYICENCIEKAYDSIEEKMEEIQAELDEFLFDNEGGEEKELPKPSQILEFLDQYVIGQTAAKRILSVAIYNHYKMLQSKFGDEKSDVELDKSNVVMIGPTGSGKTFLNKIIAKILDVPFATADASSFTSAG